MPNQIFHDPMKINARPIIDAKHDYYERQGGNLKVKSLIILV